MTFDPYSDRLARDIRNSLSSAMVGELSGNDGGVLSAEADGWLAGTPAPVYRTYIEERLALYRRVIDRIRADNVTDPRRQAIYLWNRGLFFELHELLETLWPRTRDPEYSALKGWIQAAGVYVHFQRGKHEAARSLGRKAVTYLRKGREALGYIANLDQIIDAVSDPTEEAPQIVAMD